LGVGGIRLPHFHLPAGLVVDLAVLLSVEVNVVDDTTGFDRLEAALAGRLVGFGLFSVALLMVRVAVGIHGAGTGLDELAALLADWELVGLGARLAHEVTVDLVRLLLVEVGVARSAAEAFLVIDRA